MALPMAGPVRVSLAAIAKSEAPATEVLEQGAKVLEAEAEAAALLMAANPVDPPRVVALLDEATQFVSRLAAVPLLAADCDEQALRCIDCALRINDVRACVFVRAWEGGRGARLRPSAVVRVVHVEIAGKLHRVLATLFLCNAPPKDG